MSIAPKLMKENEERKSNQYAILQDLKILNYTANATNLKKDS